MKIIRKERLAHGRRHVYLLGIKVFSYRRDLKKGKKASLLYRFFTYPLAVYDDYKRLKRELKMMG